MELDVNRFSDVIKCQPIGKLKPDIVDFIISKKFSSNFRFIGRICGAKRSSLKQNRVYGPVGRSDMVQFILIKDIYEIR